MTDVRIARSHARAGDPDRRLMAEVRRRAREVLDRMDVTDLVYHDLSYSEPLVVDLCWRAWKHALSDGKVLLVGGNAYLRAVLADSGCALDAWDLVDEMSVQAAAGTAVTPSDICARQLPSGGPYDLIVLPLVLEHVNAHPVEVLRTFAGLLSPDGRLVIATGNLLRLASRTRALLGRGFLPDPRHAPRPLPGGWPVLRQHRLYALPELVAWAAECGLAATDVAFSIGHAAVEPSSTLGPGAYLALRGKHLLRCVAPSVREHIVCTLHRTAESTPRAALAPLTTVDSWNPDAGDHRRLPLVSVILLTEHRPEQLRAALEALAQQTYPFDRYEVLVVDDTGADDAREAIEAASAVMPVRVVCTQRIGPAAARNVGMRHAEGEVVAHTDDRSQVSRGWIEAGVLGFEADVAVVTGPIVAANRPTGWFSATVERPTDDGTFPASNVFLRRELALEAGGFDESTPEGSGDLWSSALAWRLLRRGYGARFRDCFAYASPVRLGFLGWLLEGWRAGRSLPALVRAAPEVRTHLIARRFASRSSVAFEVGLLGTVIASCARRPAWLAAWAPWLLAAGPRACAGPWPPERWPRLVARLGLLSARQLLHTAGLAWGSLRARRLVL